MYGLFVTPCAAMPVFSHVLRPSLCLTRVSSGVASAERARSRSSSSSRSTKRSRSSPPSSRRSTRDEFPLLEELSSSVQTLDMSSEQQTLQQQQVEGQQLQQQQQEPKQEAQQPQQQQQQPAPASEESPFKRSWRLGRVSVQFWYQLPDPVLVLVGTAGFSC